MDEQQKIGDSINATISGATISGQVAVGQDINQTQVSGVTQPKVTEADLDQLRRLLADLKTQVEAQAAPEKRDAALERVGELQEAITAPEPDLTTLEYVSRWFARNLPKLAGAVTSVVVHPIVGKLVEAAGEGLADDFRRRFGIQSETTA